MIMIEEDSDDTSNKNQDRNKPERIERESLARTKHSSLLRRQENIQILTAIGILGLAGTLFAQNLISFPLIDTLANAPNSELFARVFVYLNIAFLFSKVSLMTIRSQGNLISSSERKVPYERRLFSTRLAQKAKWIDQRILPAVFTGLLIIIPIEVILLFSLSYVENNAPDININIFVWISTAVLIFAFLLPLLQILTAGLLRKLNQIRKGGAGEDYIRKYRTKSSDDFMTIRRTLERLSGTEEHEIDKISERIEKIISKSREETSPEKINKYNILSRKLIRNFPMFAIYITRQGMSSDDREALNDYLKKLRMFEISDGYDREEIIDMYEFLDEFIAGFEEEFDIKIKEDQNGEEVRESLDEETE